MSVRATYRIQFTSDFRFADAARLAPYLSRLGISHLYASPILAAREGSTHGYDGVHYSLISPELGGEDEFRAMAATFREHGMGVIVDFVPNHMGVGGADNVFWLSVLEWGQQSPVAGWFDIDWESPTPGLAGKVLMPFLGDQYGEVLARGELELRYDADRGAFAVWAHDTHKLPICPQTYAMILRAAPGYEELAADFEAAGEAGPADPVWADLRRRLRKTDPTPALAAFRGTPGDLESWAALDRLAEAQNWRAAKFSMDSDAINYRRFFTMSDLAGVRVEKAEVFAGVHRLILRLMEEGVVEGIRIDHIDGLVDPKGYCLRLRGSLDRPFPLYVEKILAPDEILPESWQADGTTGYEFANLAVGLLADPAGCEALTQVHADFTGQTAAPEDLVHQAKLEIMAQPMAAELESLSDRLLALVADDPRRRDFGRAAVRSGLSQVVAALDVYRTYADRDGLSPPDRARIEGAVERARARAPEVDPGIYDFIADVMTLELAGEQPDKRDEILALVLRLQQFTGPVMAKGLEDRALYRYARFIALNEVGSEPGHFGVSLETFHRANRDRLEREPGAMLTTSTHDTKRGEDARMRIAAISGHVGEWARKVDEWHGLLASEDAPVDRNEEYFFYQLLLGVWPMDWTGPPPAEDLAALRERVEAGMLKSIREAAVNSRWVFGNEEYEAAFCAFIGRALGAPDSAFLRSFLEFHARIRPEAEANILAQTVLKLTVPGMPDIYQGAELWEQSLVDPDNRRPVDFALRERLLAELVDKPPAEAPSEGGALKMALTARLLRLRAEAPALLARGSYEPLEMPEGICAFLREAEGRRMLVACRLNRAQGADAKAVLPAGRWRDLVSGETLSGELNLGRLPVAVLVDGAE
ncbi:malto-oligosyltrehalose synthase [Cereibacter azotoformans]|uniref:Maltooligosyl trehalose synthase n=1 Tax=Cereibacter azotoformans TaxID=43057 RepID=A0A2T5KDQ2_9RHOB|nr:malto-oligosyltrehalose synthase [Cereibacter azotoformans]AXQ93733.1 malto-oligosyltrehalose synthase [Cereibacter sphaeroides]MBO4168473.1 malto-oligosyltrehalose synthase [Cereibacter azotoformans]PTR20539.1 maltooligosyl trehalose synthase [Cereibacter azotoformans]UIJ29240.1 malto-oligosyltrehalose synthase [Cereibacter azotoformans]